ncbi:hypothetical protein MMC19_003333 [Ptychographa xylographoides]|nr:hypothetical protein [Ptychographa xylographoides]
MSSNTKFHTQQIFSAVIPPVPSNSIPPPSPTSKEPTFLRIPSAPDIYGRQMTPMATPVSRPMDSIYADNSHDENLPHPQGLGLCINPSLSHAHPSTPLDSAPPSASPTYGAVPESASAYQPLFATGSDMPMAWRHLAPLQCMMGPATPAEGFDAMPSLLASGGESQYGDGEPGMDEVSSVFADDSSDPGFAEEEEDDEYAHKEKEDDEEESEAEEEDLGGEARFGTMRRYRCKNFWSEVDCKVNVLHRGIWLSLIGVCLEGLNHPGRLTACLDGIVATMSSVITTMLVELMGGQNITD